MLFRKPKGWENLSEVEKLWVKKLTRKNAAKSLAPIVRDYRLSSKPVRYLLDNYFPAAGIIQDAIIAAVQTKSPELLQILYDYCGKQNADFYKDWKASFGLFTATANAGSKECWEIVWAGNKDLPNSLQIDEKSIARILVENSYSEGCCDFLEKKVKAGDTRVFLEALKAALDQSSPLSTDMFLTVVREAKRFPEARPELGEALITVAGAGSLKKVQHLLASGIPINHRAFDAAARKGHLEIVEYLVSKGANVELLAPELLPELVKSMGPGHEMVLYLDNFCDGHYRREFEAAEEKRKSLEEKRKEFESFTLVGKDTLSEIKTLPNGGTLTILFNFTTRQQMIMVQDNTGKQPSMALQVINFSDIENAEAVELAAQRFIALDGDPKIAGEPIRLKKSIFPLKNST
jgi:hypothetical protein